MSYINVPIPEEHVPVVYALIARLQAGEEQKGASTEGAAPALDEALVTRMYRESKATHRAFMKHLAGRPSEWSYTGEVAEALDLPNGSKSAAGMLGAFGRRARHRYGGVTPWEAEWDHESGEARYRVTPEVATWIRKAAAESP